VGAVSGQKQVLELIPQERPQPFKELKDCRFNASILASGQHRGKIHGNSHCAFQVHGPLFDVWWSMYKGSPFAVRSSPFALRRSPFVRRSPFAVRRSQFAVPSSEFSGFEFRAKANRTGLQLFKGLQGGDSLPVPAEGWRPALP
jgi:hypothetical protein